MGFKFSEIEFAQEKPCHDMQFANSFEHLRMLEQNLVPMKILQRQLQDQGHEWTAG